LKCGRRGARLPLRLSISWPDADTATLMGSLSRTDLIKLVCSAPVEWEAAERCCERLRKSSALEIPGKPVNRSHIERIYTVRLSRPDAPHDVVGSDRLLNDLAAHPGDELTMVVLSEEGDLTSTPCFLMSAPPS